MQGGSTLGKFILLKKFPLVPDGFRPIAVSEQSKKIE
jgi:hypothetical protein